MSAMKEVQTLDEENQTIQKARQAPYQCRHASLSGHSSRKPWMAIAAAMWWLLMACGPVSEPAAVGAGFTAASINLPPRVEADGETLEGHHFGSNGRQVVFKGVPYAAPPVGDYRWRPPRRTEPRDGVQLAVAFPPPCAQTASNLDWYRSIAESLGQDPSVAFGVPPMSEDCLYLNVWTTNWQGDSPQPVMVWIHGGGNTVGWSTEPAYQGHHLARRGVVVVSMNYRLNHFGFMAHPGLTAESEHEGSGNYGLLDQIAALKWVQRNIASFGGDPNRVTIFGESAGARDSAFLMASPLAEGLFHGVISQSGGYRATSYNSLAQAEERGRQLGQALGGRAASADAAEALAAMRKLSVEDILSVQMASGPGMVNFDGWVLPRSLGEVFSAGDQHPVPLLIGSNANEAAMGARAMEAGRFEEMIRDRYGLLAERAMEIYAVDGGMASASLLDRFGTDNGQGCGSKYLIARMPQTGAKAWLYYFSRAQPGGTLGAFHGAEIPYVFSTPDSWMPWDAADAALAEAVGGYWTRFAATGDPNGDGSTAWPEWDPESDAYLELGDQVRAGSGLRSEACALYEEAVVMWAQQ